MAKQRHPAKGLHTAKESQTAGNLEQVAILLVGVAGFLYIGLRPVSSATTWWDLSRGRIVSNGSISPSRELLVADDQYESDWLSGVPGWWSYELAGGSGLMFCRLAILAILAGGIWGIGRRRLTSSQQVIAVIIGLGVSHEAADPGPLAWDQLGVLACFLCGYQSSGRPTPKTIIPLVVTMLMWANLGPRFAVAPFVWMSAAILRDVFAASIEAQPKNSATSWLVHLALIVLVGCVNPRGVAGWWDAARTLFPQAAMTGVSLAESPWQSLWDSSWGATEFLVIIVWSIVLLWPVRDLQVRMATGLVGILGGALAIVSAANIGWLGIWCCLSLTSLVVLERGTPRNRLATWFSSGLLRRSSLRATICLGLSTALIAAGLLSGATSGLGWGLDSRLDDRLLRLNLETIKPKGVAWSDNERAIGMWSWVTQGKLPAYDSPRRALLGNRFTDMRKLGNDLRRSRQFWYLRDDGSAGGWWLTLREHQVSLLLVDAEDVRLLRAMAPTIWQPLMLDTPTILFARAGDLDYRNPMLEALSQRDLVEFGAWQYPGVNSTGSDFDRDRWGLSPPVDAPHVALRQARVFRTIPLPVAALRVLNWLRREHPSETAFEETLEIHNELQRREFLATGARSPLRPALLKVRASRFASDKEWTREIATDPSDRSLDLSEVASAYLASDFAAAEHRLAATNDLRAALVQALLQWETGNPDAAIQRLATLTESELPQEFRNLTRWWLQILDPEEPAEPLQPSADPHVPRGNK